MRCKHICVAEILCVRGGEKAARVTRVRSTHARMCKRERGRLADEMSRTLQDVIDESESVFDGIGSGERSDDLHEHSGVSLPLL